ncbi:helix-turn-helix domain-containing protein [Anaeromicropila populeti]|uniref:AraC-type DNA-binding protein n=1 Tax=Anaeromicropila populeti TaxID=37658 RepID=A0A1I6JQZ5_9FIRM|nr:AraC family transcriptional regulator [Anaeromicropila populeti]SFR81409.1 AraC-type DNA-binding protein [Anaeromicropila populeti]
MKYQKELVYREFVRRENNIFHAPYNPELEFYSVIKSGDLKKTKELCSESLMEKKGLGNLSDNCLRNIIYHFAITTALVARYCIEGGMELATAYSLSDFYIHKADLCKIPEEVSNLHPIMCMDYANRMRNLRKQKICSKPVAICIDYICDNLHTRITIKTLSELVNLSTSYLSRLFKKEAGVTLSDYIQNKKIETAQNMLIYSDFTPAQIASVLAFPNQSYFTEIFRKKTGITPKKYQTLYFRNIGIGHLDCFPR